MRATATLSDLPNTPAGAAPPMPPRIGRLLVLLQVLIGYGREFAATLYRQTVTPQLRLTLQPRFGTADFARILIRIGRALRLAAALDSRLRQQAATGQDVKTSAELALAPPRSRGNRSISPAHRRATGTGTAETNPLEDELPSEAEIAALARRGTIGAVIAESCRDLGLVPGVVSQQQWTEVHHAIIMFGGNFARLIGGRSDPHGELYPRCGVYPTADRRGDP
jgi:hypothetical protein